jgi:hypothetical protein
MTADQYLKILNKDGTLPREAIYDLIEQLRLCEYELSGVSKLSAVIEEDGTLTTVGSFAKRIEIVQSELTVQADSRLQPPLSYIRERLVYSMADVLIDYAKFSESENRLYYFHQINHRALLYVLKPKDYRGPKTDNNSDG